VRAAAEQQRAGSGSPTAVLKLQTEHARRKDSLVSEGRRLEHSLAGINRHIARELLHPLPAYRLPELAPPVAYSSNLVQRAVQHEPRLLVLAAELRAAQAQAEVARKSRLPEVGGFLEGRQYSGDGGFREATIGVKLTLPWFNGGRYRSDYDRDRARVDAVRFELENAAQMIREELHQLTVELDAARREALLYRDDILPRARVVLEMAHSQWLNGQVALAEPLEARRQWLEARQQFVRAVASQHQLLSDLVLVGGFANAAELDSFLQGKPSGDVLHPSIP
jgi:outer membrane protein, heavy metal efflux system